MKSKQKVIDDAREEGKTVQFATLMDLCHLTKSELDNKFQKYKRCVVPRGDVVEYDSGSYAVCTEQGSSGVTHDSRQSSGRDVRTSRMRRTSKRSSIALHSSDNGRRAKTTGGVGSETEVKMV